jgi:DNA polymerase-3 subunit chi
MTEITFHFNVADPMAYVCRLVRKAMRMAACPVVTGPPATLDRLDRQLWAFDPVSFVPHVRLKPGTAVTPSILATPVWLVDDTTDSERHDVLVNLGAQPPTGFESFTRLMEIVSTEAEERAAGRLRWKHYQDRGYKIVEHAVSA